MMDLLEAIDILRERECRQAEGEDLGPLDREEQLAMDVFAAHVKHLCRYIREELPKALALAGEALRRFVEAAKGEVRR